MSDDRSRSRPLLPSDLELGRSGTESHPYYLLDVFTVHPLAGNQLAVFTSGAVLETELMQALAKEMNLSESVFLLPPEAGGDVRARIFTPTAELPFAGHPVLGTAVLVGMAWGRGTVELETGAGVVHVDVERREVEGEEAGGVPAGGSEPVGAFGWMRQPIPSWGLYERRDELLAAIGGEGSGSEYAGLPVEAYRNGPLHVYVELPDEAAVVAVDPDLRALAQHPELGVNCFAGPCLESADAESPSAEEPGSAEEGAYWKTRMFAPALGVAEDPATGSAAGPLAVHLARHGRIAFGEEIEIRQGDELGRPSRLYARVEGTPERIERVEVGGSALVVGRGEIFLPATG